MHRRTFTAIFLASSAICVPRICAAQSSPPGATIWLPTPPIGSVSEDRLRLSELSGSDSTAGLLLRSLSSRVAPLLSRPPGNSSSGASPLVFRALVPQVDFVSNSSLPFGGNDGALWSGRGQNLRISAGGALAWGPLRLVLRPEWVVSTNDQYTVVDSTTYWAPALDGRFSVHASPWNQYPYSIDLPTRFGEAGISLVDWGQSAFWLEHSALAAGVGTENEWWGPGMRNALLLSNNAGGFPHAFLRTARPLRTALGSFEARWMVGALRESAFYDTLAANDHRSLSAAAVTWAPAGVDGLTIGAARMVMAPARNNTQPFGRWLDVFANTGRPNSVRPVAEQVGRWPADDPRFPLVDSVTPPGRDQLMSLFFRWVFPRDGLEVYAEIGRAEMPRNAKDLLLEPGHSMGYTGGMQYLRPVGTGAVRLQGEFTYLERSSSYRHRPTGSWGTSLAARQGFTHRGQMLGAAIGPGSSAQSVGVDWLAPDWGVGVYAGRTRFNDDANLLMPFPQGWCEHDVTVYPGVRGHMSRAGLGMVEIDLALPNRMNAFFQNKSGCPNGAYMRDVRGRFLSLTVRPLAKRLRGVR